VSVASAVHVARPRTVLPAHRIRTDDILADMVEKLRGHPQLERFTRMVRNCGVETRYFMRPLSARTEPDSDSVAERNAAAYGDALELAHEAAAGALDNAGLSAGDIDAVVTSHTTSWASPGLDVDLAYRLGLRPDARRTAMGSLGCVGGAHVLAKGAAEAANPFLDQVENVLVVVAETLSTIYTYREPTIRSTLYNALFGDGAAAAVVSRNRLTRGMAVDRTWEYLLPDSRDRYFGELTEHGLAFESTPKALHGTRDVMPALLEWSRSGGPAPTWCAVHPGGPRVLEDAAEGLGLSRRDLAPSWESLRHCGNLGGVALLHIIGLLHDDPPPQGQPGIGIAFGPGFTVTALQGRWT
jgi:predicted naringenin-chalcone synthase